MPLDEMAAEPIRETERAFEVYGVAEGEIAEGGAIERLVAEVCFPPTSTDGHRREAAAVERDRVADGRVVEHLCGSNAHTGTVTSHDTARLLDDAGEHDMTVPAGSPSETLDGRVLPGPV